MLLYGLHTFCWIPIVGRCLSGLTARFHINGLNLFVSDLLCKELHSGRMQIYRGNGLLLYVPIIFSCASFLCDAHPPPACSRRRDGVQSFVRNPYSCSSFSANLPIAYLLHDTVTLLLLPTPRFLHAHIICACRSVFARCMYSCRLLQPPRWVELFHQVAIRHLLR